MEPRATTPCSHPSVDRVSPRSPRHTVAAVPRDSTPAGYRPAAPVLWPDRSDRPGRGRAAEPGQSSAPPSHRRRSRSRHRSFPSRHPAASQTNRSSALHPRHRDPDPAPDHPQRPNSCCRAAVNRHLAGTGRAGPEGESGNGSRRTHSGADPVREATTAGRRSSSLPMRDRRYRFRRLRQVKEQRRGAKERSAHSVRELIQEAWLGAASVDAPR